MIKTYKKKQGCRPYWYIYMIKKYIKYFHYLESSVYQDGEIKKDIVGGIKAGKVNDISNIICI